MGFLYDLLDLIEKHWKNIALIITWGGILIVYVRNRLHWRDKRFMDQVNFSLNYLHDGKLAMRTLMELPSHEVWLNPYGVKLVMAAAAKTTIDQPFILLDDPQDQQFVHRAVLNALSERFAESYLARSLGLPVQSGTFHFAITCEKYKELRTHKLRVLILSEKTLLEDYAPGGPGDALQLTDVVYGARHTTLKAFYKLYFRDKQAGGHAVGDLELGLPS